MVTNELYEISSASSLESKLWRIQLENRNENDSARGALPWKAFSLPPCSSIPHPHHFRRLRWDTPTFQKGSHFPRELSKDSKRRQGSSEKQERLKKGLLFHPSKNLYKIQRGNILAPSIWGLHFGKAPGLWADVNMPVQPEGTLPTSPTIPYRTGAR